jgi:hypothetical protein
VNGETISTDASVAGEEWGMGMSEGQTTEEWTLASVAANVAGWDLKIGSIFSSSGDRTRAF